MIAFVPPSGKKFHFLGSRPTWTRQHMICEISYAIRDHSNIIGEVPTSVRVADQKDPGSGNEIRFVSYNEVFGFYLAR